MSKNENIQSKHSVSDSMPLTTEEPIRRPWLVDQLKDINLVDSADSTQVDNTLVQQDEMSNNNNEEDYDNNDDDDDESDDELRRITEANRHININSTKDNNNNNNNNHNNNNNNKKRERSISTHDPGLRKLLVFADPSTNKVFQQPDRKVVTMIYGAGPQEEEEEEEEEERYRRRYLVACDFSHESLHAMEWTMGTMLRDHDELHIVTVSNREDNPDIVNQSGMNMESEIETSLKAIVDEATKRLSKMMLYDIKLVCYSVVGRVKDVLKSLIRSLSLTMVVCGSRGRGTMKGLLMGSVSTYLVHKSLVPVAVIQPQKKKKKEIRHTITATPLSESVKSGQLHVDELN
ncbi:uncharacterized protein BX664DRAFT_293040 [Halteromyces radiatus]|uniref:uncharacterized protein n=1 Tax=Halteromyces radiatus TaxID=101107 RepID=UPI00221E48C2|nr:uncharacterized protein BX664DRAFT_293040 [Halteromyces radiatus]KAI8097484.1 hypothetical protein BX664DRAFT_293040 [Halteromyces radiatus]